MPHPMVPFTTSVDAWDHPWFLWLPRHPIYEAVEVASREPDRDGRVAVWVWFTERAGAKRQVHYRNDPQLATFVGGNYRPIDYRIAGEDALRSQFVIVVVSTPICCATSDWKRLRSNRRLRMCSPKVLISFG